MDQRVDNERRLETAPGREAKPAVGQARPDGPWLERLRARRRMVLILTALVIVAVAATVFWWVNSVAYESTDDAFIDARTVPVSAQVSAAIVDVPVTDNQLVEAGAVLVAARRPRLSGQRRSGQGAGRPGAGQHRQCRRSGRGAAGAHRAGREADRAGAGGAHVRAAGGRPLPASWSRTGAGTVEQAQQYSIRSAAGQARSRRRAGNAIATEKQLPVLKAQREVAPAQLEQARAAQEQAEANLSRTTITAPAAGRVARADRGQRRLCAGRPGADDVRAARRLGHREFQGDAARPHAPRPAGR